MKKIFLIMAVALTACTNNSDKTGHESHGGHQEKVAGLQLNEGKKWKADDATRKNVAAVKAVMSDSSFVEEQNRKAFADQLQQRLDVLVQDCRMKGPDHDALHLWLEKVLQDVKALGDERKDFTESAHALHKDVGDFDVYFE